jgi:hypothetical protein
MNDLITEWQKAFDDVLQLHGEPEMWFTAREVDGDDFFSVVNEIATSPVSQLAIDGAIATGMQIGFEVARKRYG